MIGQFRQAELLPSRAGSPPQFFPLGVRFGKDSTGRVLAGLGAGIVWGFYLSPLGSSLTMITAVYLAALPAAAALFSSFIGFDLVLIARSMVAWRRLAARFVPGPGGASRGYVVLEDAKERDEREAREQLAELDLAALWEED